MQWPSVTVFRVSLPQESVSASVKTRTRVAVDLVLDSVTFAAELRNSEALDFWSDDLPLRRNLDINISNCLAAHGPKVRELRTDMNWRFWCRIVSVNFEDKIHYRFVFSINPMRRNPYINFFNRFASYGPEVG